MRRSRAQLRATCPLRSHYAAPDCPAPDGLSAHRVRRAAYRCSCVISNNTFQAECFSPRRHEGHEETRRKTDLNLSGFCDVVLCRHGGSCYLSRITLRVESLLRKNKLV